jgi:proton-dependent oligopeptide transporter, POT family
LTFFGHPRGLATLFFTEYWERFSYYGMRALLILFMTASLSSGGLGFDVPKAAAIYGIYTASVYLAALPGGLLVDRLVGQRRGVFVGGSIIALGHFTMAIRSELAFYLALVLIVTGTGVLKPSVTAMVGALYPDGGAQRDAGFSIFYMGINLGASVAPIVTGFLGQRIDWHLGFGVAGLGMVLGLVQYRLGANHLGVAGVRVSRPDDARAWWTLALGASALVILVALMVSVGRERFQIPIGDVANAGGPIILIVVLVYFLLAVSRRDLTSAEKRQLGAIGVFFVFSAVCWSALEQAGSTLNLFAQRHTALSVLGFAMPASWLQSVTPILIIGLSPVFAWLWVAMAQRQLEPSSLGKFTAGLCSIGLGFGVMVLASMRAANGRLVSPWWLVAVYLLHAVGELSFSPVGYSLVTKLSPPVMVSQLLGIWLTSIALGNLIASRVAGQVGLLPLPQLFGLVAAATVGAGMLLLAMSSPIRRLTGAIR